MLGYASTFVVLGGGREWGWTPDAMAPGSDLGGSGDPSFGRLGHLGTNKKIYYSKLGRRKYFQMMKPSKTSMSDEWCELQKKRKQKNKRKTSE